mmetsp:Transcript_2228/g.4692  ORF Transcript_2228/g.4692 Transcript_2228/m.4692 type:complete len:84 (-) Transcript_2228:94-345(-)
MEKLASAFAPQGQNSQGREALNSSTNEVLSEILAANGDMTLGELIQTIAAREKERIWKEHTAEVVRLRGVMKDQLQSAKARVA